MGAVNQRAHLIDVPELAGMTREQLVEELIGLRQAMRTRAVIEQAKGIVMATRACCADDAFDVLVAQSQHENRKLHEVAADLVASQHRREAPATRSRWPIGPRLGPSGARSRVPLAAGDGPE